MPTRNLYVLHIGSIQLHFLKMTNTNVHPYPTIYREKLKYCKHSFRHDEISTHKSNRYIF